MQNPEDFVSGVMVLCWLIGAHVGMAGVFQKAGMPLWHAFVPFLNGYQLCRVAGISPTWLLAIFVPLLNLGFMLYLGIRLSRRFGYGDWFGVALGFSGFGLLPIVGFSNRAPQSDLDIERSLSLDTLDAVEADQRRTRRSAFVALLVLTMLQLVCLLCVPGLLIVGVMAFDGASSITGPMELSIGLAMLIPVSLLAALAAQWSLYAVKRYKLALGMTAIPILNVTALFCSVPLWLGH